MRLTGGRVYLPGSSTGKDGLDHDSRAPASYDTKTEPFPIVGQLYHLHMTPLTWQRSGQQRGGGRKGGEREKSIVIELLNNNRRDPNYTHRHTFLPALQQQHVTYELTVPHEQ